jgi:hypothetical protein
MAEDSQSHLTPNQDLLLHLWEVSPTELMKQTFLTTETLNKVTSQLRTCIMIMSHNHHTSLIPREDIISHMTIPEVFKKR